MKIKPQNITAKIPNGEYTGNIIEQSQSADMHFQWFKIEVDGIKDILNVSLPIDSVLFNEFAMCFCDENGEMDTEYFVDTPIRFTVISRNINGMEYSKLRTIEPIDDAEEVDDDD